MPVPTMIQDILLVLSMIQHVTTLLDCLNSHAYRFQPRANESKCDIYRLIGGYIAHSKNASVRMFPNLNFIAVPV